MTRSVDQELMRLLHGELPPAAAAALRKTMAGEPELAAAYERMEHSWSALALPPPSGVPPGFSGRVMARVARLPRPNALSWGAAPLWVRAAAAACLIVGAAVGAGVGERWSEKPQTDTASDFFGAVGAVEAEGSESLAESYWGEVADSSLDGAGTASAIEGGRESEVEGEIGAREESDGAGEGSPL
jgi:hypothetical protein